MENASSFRIVFISTSSFENARNISRILVSEKLAACCTIVPSVFSIYAWEDVIEENSEVMLMIKTSALKLGELEARITELHPYDVPEIVSVALDQSARPYLNWMQTILHEEQSGE
ncbi:MAG TPA: divalent-cation tolerance protein CutA [Patescibacteria group bacterium]|nr:divalent-cation tolerance protein CutA [Patescibacteria group bacterium]